MNGLAPQTSALITKVSELECIRPYLLVGGTALSLQIKNRESEDLDFMKWRTSKSEKREVDWPQIKKELSTIGTIEKMDLLDLDHVEFKVDGVKLSFYVNPNASPVNSPVHYLNNIYLADKKSIGAMKIEVMLRRSKFRDYYDIYSLLKVGEDINEMIELATKYSGHRLKTKNIISLLSNSTRFTKESDFKNLNPIYDICPLEIEEYIKSKLKRR